MSRGRIDEEMRHHLAELESQLLGEGWSATAARQEARRRFGDPHLVARRTRAVDAPIRSGLRTGLLGDLTQAWRGLVRARLFTATVVTTLALALGATVTVFAVVYGVLLRPLGFADPDRLVTLYEVHAETGTDSSPTSEGTFQDWRRALAGSVELAGWEGVFRTLEDPQDPEELLAAEVTPNLLSVLGITPALGRDFTADDAPVEGRGTAALLSHQLWTRRFGADPAVVGTTIPMDGVQVEIAGVLPPDLTVPGSWATLLVPSRFTPDNETNRGGRIVKVGGSTRGTTRVAPRP